MILSQRNTYTLGDICSYTSERIEIEKVTLEDYISTENMLPEKEGVTLATSLPNAKSVLAYSKGDILISNIRPYFKKIWLANKMGGASNDVLIFKSNGKIVDSKYLYYFLSQDRFFDFVMGTSKGTKMPRGDKEAILKYNVDLPNLEEQKVIAHILSTLDEKIEVNKQVNKTLEAVAQEIFKHWFIDFEFPNENGEPYKSSGGEMVESELGMIPERWEVKELGDLCDITSSKRIFMNEYVSEGIPFYRGKEIIEKSKGSVLSTELYISIDKYNEIKRKFSVPVKGDILLTSVGTLGVPYKVDDEEFYFKDGNLTWFRNYIKKEYSNYLYLWLLSKEGKKSLDSITIGSTQKALTIVSLKKLKLAVCNDAVLKKFEGIVGNLIDKIYCNNKEKEYLMNLRDTLLPKLMSGEIRVPLDNNEVSENHD